MTVYHQLHEPYYRHTFLFISQLDAPIVANEYWYGLGDKAVVRVSGKTSVGGRRMVIRLLTPTVVGVILWEATGSVKNGKYQSTAAMY